MSDYIEREAALDTVKRTSGDYAAAWAEIAHMPTVDAVPVVRCKDCTYFSNAKINTKGFLICPASGMEITEDDYCSYGERKEANT